MTYRSIGICLLASAVFAACALVVSVANAAPNWTVGGAELGLGVSEELNETATLTKFGSETNAEWKLIIPEFQTLTCTSKFVLGARVTGKYLDSAKSITYHGCKVLGPRGEATVCTVTSNKGTNGTIVFSDTKTELKKTGTNFTYDYFDVLNGETLVTIEIGSCALSGSYKVTGTFAMKPEYNTNANLLGFESSKSIQESAGVTLKFGVRPAFPQEKIDLSLKSGKTWGVTP